MSQTVSDPGNEPSSPRAKLGGLMAWIDRHPHCTLAGGEAKLLVDEIHHLREQLENLANLGGYTDDSFPD